MKYNHILVALELSEASQVLIDKAASLREMTGAEVSFIHIDGSVGELSSELTDLQIEPDARPLNDYGNQWLHRLQDMHDYPIKHFLVGTGNLGDKLTAVVDKYQCDVLICGHHHDLWNSIVSYSRQLINHSNIDILVVPIKE